ncbi:MAG: IS5 family transposase [Bacillales bacterium]|nr:IS5 family transposase [Bacillales bacterium]
MYQETQNQLTFSDDFFLPFGGKLNKENRWVLLAEIVPWGKAEEKYAKAFKNSFKGEKALSVRVALGALFIQERLGCSDRETVQQITENPYLQYFIGLPSFQETAPFHHSLMTHFRKRLGPDIINEVNEWIVMEEQKQDKENDDNDQDSNPPSNSDSSEDVVEPDTNVSEEMTNNGKLWLDATCAPADIAYPTDLGLLNEAREKLEHIIDVLHEPLKGSKQKPRTYRKKVRKDYLTIAKQRKVGTKKMHKAVGKQLRYVKRDLGIIQELVSQSSLSLLSKQEYRELLVIQELYRQQEEMHRTKTHRIDDRIVSISQPHVRPIVRGKAKANVEFGSKVAVSVVDGYVLVEKLDWDNFNEGITLQESVENYRNRFGFYPEAVLADKIYRNRENLQYCKERGIRLSGPKLGRPSKEEDTAQRLLAKKDASERNAVEGKFGEGKRSYGLGLIRARLQDTSETVVCIQFLVMNLERKLRVLFCHFFRELFARMAVSENFQLVIRSASPS